MNKIRICCNKGTSFIESEPKQSKWFSHNMHLQSRISKEENGLRIICSKGTATFWVKKVAKIHMYTSKILVYNKGTKCSVFKL